MEFFVPSGIMGASHSEMMSAGGVNSSPDGGIGGLTGIDTTVKREESCGTSFHVFKADDD